MAVSQHSGPLERGRELERLNGLLDRAAEGDGDMIVLAGEPGIGKTLLIDAAAADARTRGFDVLVARGAELEGEYPFGIARQLFERLVRGASEERRGEIFSGAAELAEIVLDKAPTASEKEADPALAALHGLYWTLANLARDGPILVAIDDAHWADLESIRWLEYLSRRLSGLPVGVLAAVRPDEPRARGSDLAALLAGKAASVLEPAPLSKAAVAELCAEAFEDRVEAEFVAACHQAAGGNPFLVRELLTALAESEVEPVAANASRALAIGPTAVRRAVLARIASLPDECRALAGTMAIVGDGMELRLLSELTALDHERATNAAELLSAAAIIAPAKPPRFRHAILRTSIREDLSPFQRDRIHAQAARILADNGASRARIAAQLMACDPAGSEWAVDRLREAAAESFARGSPGSAAELLRRALAEPPSDSALRDVLVELGSAERLARQAGRAIEHLSLALERTHEPVLRGAVSRSLAAGLTLEGRPVESIRVLERAISVLPENARELRLRIEAEIQAMGLFDPAAYRLASVRSDRQIAFDPDEPGGRPLLAAVALSAAKSGPAAEAARIALAACADGQLLSESGSELFAFYLGVIALTLAHEWEAAMRESTAAYDTAASRGWAPMMSFAIALRTGSHRQTGAVAQALADARAYSALRQETPTAGLTNVVTSLMWALIERGELDEAESTLAAYPDLTAASSSSEFIAFAGMRGRLRMAQGRDRDALEDLRLCGRLERAYGFETPSVTSWRSDAALCLSALGEREEAVDLSAEGLARARVFGAPRPLGMAIRAAALLEDGGLRIEMLQEAVATLEASADRLEHARALTDLGAALRRQRSPTEGRGALDEALALARSCGATAIAERAHTELEATGVRRRKLVVGGLDSLTPSELRVAELAAAGRSNRQIAELLFVTTKTVETHLYRAYRKLDITSREELAGALRSS